MYTLLPQILNMSLTASIVIVLVLAARFLFKKAPKVFSYALWAVVLFRLVCPVSFSSQLSLMGLFNMPSSTSDDSAYSSMNFIPADIVHTEFPQVNLPLPGISEAINSNLPQGREQLVADPLEAPMAFGTLLWLMGSIAMLIYSVISFVNLRRKLVGAVRLRDNIYLADHIVTPFVLGVFRPKIYLPSTLREEEQSYVILHEQTHIRRLDHIVKILAFLALAVHWFNPLVWVAFVLAVKDMEMSCDERVLKLMGGEIKGAYGASLLSLATGRHLINGSPLAFGEGNIKGRIKNVMNFKKPAAWVIVISVLLVAALSIAFASNGAVNVSGHPDESFGDSGNIPEAAFIQLSTFISEKTDLVLLGKLAFTTFMDYYSSENIPVEERIASYKLNEISVLAGDINEFCVALNYDITTDSDGYLNPALCARGKGTWPDNYMEIRVAKHADDNVYSVKSVGTGG
ncbi:MAG: hypothetical protein GXY05_15450, partial [Clostridiales bacterium]|nr:hypothetical protein [Clostridiales bacterium]